MIVLVIYYLKSRYYDSEIGSFISIDKIIGANQDILSYNLFTYCSNNFINNVDPNGNFIISLAKIMWKAVVQGLHAIGMKTSAEFLNDSIDGKAKYIIYGSTSRVANQIKEDSAFKEQVDIFVSDTDTGYVEKSEVVQFENDDLQGSIMHGTVSVKGNVVNGCGPLSVTVHDVYDFDYSSGYFDGDLKNFAFTIGNNLAAFDENFGVINNYDVYVVFEYDPCS